MLIGNGLSFALFDFKTYFQVFLWIGTNSNKLEKESSMTAAIEYLTHDPCGRDKDTPIITVKQGFEPPTFTGWFDSWDPEIWSVSSLSCLPVNKLLHGILLVIMPLMKTQHAY